MFADSRCFAQVLLINIDMEVSFFYMIQMSLAIMLPTGWLHIDKACFYVHSDVLYIYKYAYTQ